MTKPGPATATLGDVGVGAQRGGERLGECARVLAGRLGQHHGGIGGEIAMAGVARRLDGDARQIERAAVFAFQIKRFERLL